MGGPQRPRSLCPRAFGTMRSYGPLSSARFDPHPEPAGDTSGELALYAAADLLTAIAERYQRRRLLHLADPSDPIAYSWRPARALNLVDVTGVGAVRLGASHGINSGPKAVCRRWARAVRAAWPSADGLRYSSSMTGHDCVVLGRQVVTPSHWRRRSPSSWLRQGLGGRADCSTPVRSSATTTGLEPSQFGPTWATAEGKVAAGSPTRLRGSD